MDSYSSALRPSSRWGMARSGVAAASWTVSGCSAGRPRSAEGAGGAASTLARWQPRVMQLSGLQGQGLDAFWQAVTEFQATQTANGALTERRQQQALAWMWERIDAGLKAAFRAHAQVRAALPDITQSVTQGHLPPSTAARRLLALTAEGQA